MTSDFTVMNRTMNRPLIFTRYTELKEKVPFCTFGEYPSPVEKLNALSKKTGADIWIKRDDIASCIYGGNKCRMMEWIIPDALHRGRQSLITWGALGSNQVLSSVIFGRESGFRDITAVHNEQPIHPYVKRNFLISSSLGVKQIFGSNPILYLLKLWWAYFSNLLAGKRPYLIPLLGSSPLSVLSYLDAALELKMQIDAGECPRPDYIFVTVGTGGTAAGLILGAKMLGDIGEVIGVRVVEKAFVNEWMIAWEINRALRLLRKMGVQLEDIRISRRDINLIHDYMGSGYAESTPEAEEAIKLAGEDNIQLDITYTGKTMAALLDFVKEKPDKRFLFWHTLNTVDLTPYTEKLPDPETLDTCFQKFFCEE